MTIKKDDMIKDAIGNIALKLPVSQIAKLYGVSRQRTSQLLKENGIKVDRQSGNITIRLSNLKTITKMR